MQKNAQYEENCRYELEVWKGSIHVANVAINYFCNIQNIHDCSLQYDEKQRNFSVLHVF